MFNYSLLGCFVKNIDINFDITNNNIVQKFSQRKHHCRRPVFLFSYLKCTGYWSARIIAIKVNTKKLQTTYYQHSLLKTQHTKCFHDYVFIFYFIGFAWFENLLNWKNSETL